MTARDYQDKAMVTMMPTCDNFIYMVGLLHEEAGELQGKFNKAVRKGMIEYEGNKFRWKGSAEDLLSAKESQVTALARVLPMG